MGSSQSSRILGRNEFNRIRVGINRPSNGMPIVDYVLGRFSKEETEMVKIAVEKSAEACEEWIGQPFLHVMNTYN